MDWINQDWEHESLKDDIYIMEHHKQIEAEWQQWEQRNKRLPAIIQVLTPITTNETECNTRTIRRAHQTKL
jgi:hypothetical protein